jgi:hypothetical protein
MNPNVCNLRVPQNDHAPASKAELRAALEENEDQYCPGSSHLPGYFLGSQKHLDMRTVFSSDCSVLSGCLRLLPLVNRNRGVLVP